jgi:hypothetical protein
MDDVLTWDEIVEKYPDEWVLIDEPETTALLDVVRGRVVAHDISASVVERCAFRMRLRDSALLFTGEPDPSVVFVL